MTAPGRPEPTLRLDRLRDPADWGQEAAGRIRTLSLWLLSNALALTPKLPKPCTDCRQIIGRGVGA